jgi:hypothetical protein
MALFYHVLPTLVVFRNSHVWDYPAKCSLQRYLDSLQAAEGTMIKRQLKRQKSSQNLSQVDRQKNAS